MMITPMGLVNVILFKQDWYSFGNELHMYSLACGWCILQQLILLSPVHPHVQAKH